GITRRRLLEWETADSVARRQSSSRRAYLTRMTASLAIAVAVILLVVLTRPSALAVAAPVLTLWIAAPFIAFRLSRPIVRRRREIDPADRTLLTEIARSTWRYFETFSGPDDHGLPPDSVQLRSDLRVAHRTSPTNIGMGLLGALAAHD